METLQCEASGTSESDSFSDSHLCMHHSFQHSPGSTPNILSPTRQLHEHTPHQILHNSPCFPPSHSLPYPHHPCPHLRAFRHPFSSKNNKEQTRHNPSPTYRCRPFHRHLLHGRRSPYRKQKEEHVSFFKQNHLHLLDHTTVLDFWNFGDVYCSGTYWVLLHAVIARKNAVISYWNDLLFLLIWVLSELFAGFTGEQVNFLKFKKWWLA